MRLFYRSYGQGFPIVALHGLYASSDSWMNLVSKLSDTNRLILVDQRNHGRSPHSIEHSYAAMCKDLRELLDELSLQQVILLGHSMGGKTAMYFTLRHPERVKGLIVEDISPLAYPNSHEIVKYHKMIMNKLQTLPLRDCRLRAEAELLLLDGIHDSTLCKFLLKNLQRAKANQLKWRININSLYENLINIMDDVIKGCAPVKKAALFIKGSESGYIGIKDENAVRHYFPKAILTTIQNVGHWVHNEQENEFLQNVKLYLSLLNSID